MTIYSKYNGSYAPETYCGYDLPPNKYCEENYLKLKFYADHYNYDSFSGFELSYTCVGNVPNITNTTTTPPVSCEPSYYYGPSGMISSPNYPENYPSNADCYYYIYCESTQHINITFETFALESHPNCS